MTISREQLSALKAADYAPLAPTCRNSDSCCSDPPAAAVDHPACPLDGMPAGSQCLADWRDHMDTHLNVERARGVLDACGGFLIVLGDGVFFADDYEPLVEAGHRTGDYLDLLDDLQAWDESKMTPDERANLGKVAGAFSEYKRAQNALESCFYVADEIPPREELSKIRKACQRMATAAEKLQAVLPVPQVKG